MESSNKPVVEPKDEMPDVATSPNKDGVVDAPTADNSPGDQVASPLQLPEAAEEESFLVENQRETLKGWGGLDIGVVMAEPALATSRADFHAAQIVAGSDTTEAGRALVAELMQYELYRGAFKESAVKFYADMPERLRPALEPGLALANSLIKDAESRYGVAQLRNEAARTPEELETLHLLYGSRIDVVKIPTGDNDSQPKAVELFDQKFGSLGVFQGSFQEAFDHAVVQVDEKEKQLLEEEKNKLTAALEHAKSVSNVRATASADEQVEIDLAPPLVAPIATAQEDDSASSPLTEPAVPPNSTFQANDKTQVVPQTVGDSIWVGPPRPNNEAVPPEVSNIDKDALLARLDNQLQPDKSVLYTLDGEPAFIDRGLRLEMAEGGSQNEEKVLAALLTAAQYYRGRIELTGSEAFQKTAISLIAHHKLNVVMKNPGQQAQLEDARRALHADPVEKNAVAGESPPPFGGDELPEMEPGKTAPVAAGTANAPTAATAQQYDLGVSPQQAPSQVVRTPAAPMRTVIAPDSTPAPTHTAIPKNSTPKISPEVHQNTQAAANGVTGKVLACGNAPFRFDNDAGDSVFIKLRTRTGVETYWGKELAGLLRSTRVQPNSVVTLQYLGKEPVTIKVPIKDAHGKTMGYEDKDTHRNQWSLTKVGGPTVRTGQDEAVNLTAFDAQRFGHVQQTLISRLRLDVPLPEAPKDGLFWLTPDGQGSGLQGDELTAQRPAPNKTGAGQQIISSWSADGHLDMALVLSDGPYLQGVVRQGGHYQHVLVSLPDTTGAPPMIFNAVTPDGLVPIGSGNAINRSGGEPVVRENIVFKLDGDSEVRIGKLDNPAEMNPVLHARLGFDERWRDDNTLPKSAPAAAPTAQPGDPRPA